MSEYSVPVVKVRSADAPGGFYLLNESDFDPKANKLFDEAVQSADDDEFDVDGSDDEGPADGDQDPGSEPDAPVKRGRGRPRKVAQD